MKLPDGTILMDGDLQHRAPYDPTKAHEYYIRTRKLHPRQGGAQKPSGIGAAAKAVVKANPVTAQKAKAQARVTSLQKKLTELQDALKRKLAAEQKDKKAPTSADKAKRAKEAKKYRKSHKQELANKAREKTAKTGGGSGTKTSDLTKSEAAGGGSIKEIRAAITTVQTALTAAKARLHALGG